MKMLPTHSLILSALTLVTAAASAVDWEAAQRTPAEITVLNGKATPLTGGEGGQFLKVPEKLAGASIFVSEPGKKMGDTADFTVVKEGYLFVAAHYAYEGNSSGDWDNKRWDEAKFKKSGWEIVTDKQMGGKLIDKGNSEWKVFAKRVRPKDSMRLIVNKYSAPALIVLTDQKKP